MERKRIFLLFAAAVFISSLNLAAQDAAGAVDPPDAAGAFDSQAAGTAPWDRARLLDAALEEGSAYLLAESRSREAASVLSEAKAAGLPTIRYNSNLSYMTNPPSVTLKAGSFGTIPMLGALPGEDYTIRLSEKTRYEFGLSLEQPVFTWGRIGNSVKAARMGTRAAAIQAEQERRTLETVLDIHLVSLGYFEEIAGILEEQSATAGRLMEISQESYAGGFILQTDLLEARLLASEVQLNGYALEESRDKSLLALRTLTGLPELSAERLALPPREDAAKIGGLYSRENRDELVPRAMAESLGLKLLACQTQAAERLLAASRGQFYGKPELGLMLQLGYSGPAFPFIEKGWQDDNSGNFTATLAIRGLLFDGGTVTHTIRQKQEQLEQARLEETKGRRELQEYVEKALHQLEVSRLRQDYYRLQIHAAEAQKEQAESAWKAGYGEEREILAKELQRQGQRIALLQEELSALVLSFQLKNILGD